MNPRYIEPISVSLSVPYQSVFQRKTPYIHYQITKFEDRGVGGDLKETNYTDEHKFLQKWKFTWMI